MHALNLFRRIHCRPLTKATVLSGVIAIATDESNIDEGLLRQRPLSALKSGPEGCRHNTGSEGQAALSDQGHLTGFLSCRYGGQRGTSTRSPGKPLSTLRQVIASQDRYGSDSFGLARKFEIFQHDQSRLLRSWRVGSDRSFS